MRHAFLAVSVSLTFGWVGAQQPVQRTLTFEDRVKAQEAIERVYYSHQIGATKPFDTAVPRATLEKKVRRYLSQSAALAKYWKTPVSDEMLRREMERTSRGGRMPDRLREVYTALGNDSFLIKECFARPLLVDRLSRNFFAFDGSLHERQREEARTLRYRVVRSGLQSLAGDRRYSETTFEVEDYSADELARYRAQSPVRVGDIGPVTEERDAFVIRSVLEDGPSRLRMATLTVPKQTWDDWWREASPGLDPSTVLPVASVMEIVLPPTPGAASASCRIDDRWNNESLNELPGTRAAHTAVWTGTLMLTWGGNGPDGVGVNLGSRYDPSTDTWSPMSTTNAPVGRRLHTAVWTGERMIVWGGVKMQLTSSDALSSGGQYDPVLDVWTATSLVNAPSLRWSNTAVWSGESMIVWGGLGAGILSTLNTGARYNPTTDTWSPTSTVGAPSARQWHTAVWAGSGMIVWGGDGDQGGNRLKTGGLYDPSNDSWTLTTTVGAPAQRHSHAAVWTGQHMIVWGGTAGSVGPYLNSGGRYDPLTDTWSPTSTMAAPTGRTRFTAVWTGGAMVVWGGVGGATFNTGGRYDPVLDAWTPTTALSAPSERAFHTAVWTGKWLVVWGGRDTYSWMNTGARYDPAADTWTPTAVAGGPMARSNHTAVWTGNLMLVWGAASPGLSAGYDPATDAWSPITSVGEPPYRTGHVAVWTGDEMVVWGGHSVSALTNTGGRYDPIGDAWTATSVVGALSARSGATAVWTGAEMLVWGGDGNIPLSDGGRYDPFADHWASISTAGAPSPRGYFSNVWTGSSMIVWGGYTGTYPYTFLNTGARYDPSSDSWSAMSVENAPTPRYQHVAAWTGDRMVVWGGASGAGGSTFLPSGGRYDPLADSWQPVSAHPTFSTPGIQAFAWTGLEMIVWMSGANGSFYSGRYNPITDSWRHMSGSNAPASRGNPSTVWTGEEMILWGGFAGTASVGTGGRYFAATCDPLPYWYFDFDGDGYGSSSAGACCQPAGYVPLGGDCNEANPAINPGATEVCNGLDDDCDGTVDYSGVALCDDINVCTDDSCDGVAGCSHIANTESCDDGSACTVGDICGGGVCISGDPVVCLATDACHAVGTCDPTTGLCSNPIQPNGSFCDDNDLCTTGEACLQGSCTPSSSGLDEPNPRTNGYYMRLCHGPHSGDELTDADAACVNELTQTFAGIATEIQVCDVIRPSQPNGDACDRTEDDLMVLALNICRARVCVAQSIDSQCGGDGDVGHSLAESDAILASPSRDGGTCAHAKCLDEEINTGRALELNSLRLRLEGGGVRLEWAPPYFDDGAGQPRKYNVWRRAQGSLAPFAKIGDTTEPTFLDSTSGSDAFEYEVTAVIT